MPLILLALAEEKEAVAVLPEVGVKSELVVHVTPVTGANALRVYAVENPAQQGCGPVNDTVFAQ